MRAISQIGIALLWCLGAFLYVGGCIHSNRKHPADGEILRYSPFSVYRGVEMFWHDDYKGVDWDEKLKADAYTIFTFMGSVNETTQIETLTKEIDAFSKRVKEYPKSKVAYLKVAGKLFYDYTMAMFSDVLSYTDSILANNYHLNAGTWNIKSKALGDSIVRNYNLVELRGLDKQMDSIMALVGLEGLQGDTDKIEQGRISVKKTSREVAQWMNRVYQMIFREQLFTDTYGT